MTEAVISDQKCPCGSGLALTVCCGRWLHGDAMAPTAEDLMRSRYTAYVLGLYDYLLATWHPSTRPASLGGTELNWIGLKILTTSQGLTDDSRGIVEFAASYEDRGKGKCLIERSRFVQENGQWLYVDGDCKVEPIGRNDPCPCGSGKNFKRCCAG